jgi:hypothetical protein
MIVLESPGLVARIDPAHGGEILDLVDVETGRQLLGRPPFGSLPAIGGDLGEERWTASYRGGWQTVLPNAGNACELDGDQHGFHGRASNDPWSVVAAGTDAATLAWAGHGLEVEKRIAIEDGALAVRYRITAPERPAALVALEHVAVGPELLDPEVEIAFPGARTYELSEVDGPVSPPANAGAWPEARLLDGSLERVDRWPIARPRSRLLAVADLAGAWAAVRNPARGQGLALAWDGSWFRHAWVWHENRVSAGPWRLAAEVLTIEPSTVPHTLGLAAAAAHGQARYLRPGEEVRPWIVARPFRSSRPVTGVDPSARVQT